MATHPEHSEVEVFVNQIGTITIRQADQLTFEEDPVVVVHPDDISMLMRALDRAQREAVRIRAEEQEEQHEQHEEVTVPELHVRGRSGSA